MGSLSQSGLHQLSTQEEPAWILEEWSIWERLHHQPSACLPRGQVGSLNGTIWWGLHEGYYSIRSCLIKFPCFECSPTLIGVHSHMKPSRLQPVVMRVMSHEWVRVLSSGQFRNNRAIHSDFYFPLDCESAGTLTMPSWSWVMNYWYSPIVRFKNAGPK